MALFVVEVFNRLERIDILVLTERKISRIKAQELVKLRQTMIAEHPENPVLQVI